jgi:hypothetical protein
MLGCAAILIYPLSSSYALDVTLAWDANTEPDLAGYMIYYCIQSGDSYDGVGAADGDSPIHMPLDQDEDPDPSIVQFTLYDLPEGTYFIAVTAYNLAGLESDFSNEVSTASDEVNRWGTAGGGGGGCFIATATFAPKAPTKVTDLSLILVSLSLGVVAAAKGFCI